MIKKIFVILLFCTPFLRSAAQDPDGDYNPYVNSGAITPAPLATAEEGGTGRFSFIFGNSGDDALVLGEGEALSLSIRLRNGVPVTDNPLGSIGGTARNWFSWSFSNDTYTGTQVAPIGSDASGTITIDYRVTANSNPGNPENGFRATVTPAQYQRRNNVGRDDSIDVFTYTQCTQAPAPTIGAITQPDCETPQGSVILNNLPSGSWTLTRYPGEVTTTGTGTSANITGLAPGTYSFSVTQEAGCESERSENVVLNSVSIPPAPNVRVDCLFGSGFASVTVTSPTGNDYEYRLDNGNYTTARTFLGIGNGTHTISVRNAVGCVTVGSPFTVNCGCFNRPVINIPDRTGSTCASEPITESGNTFGGSATQVTITEDGAGSVSPASVSDSPFSFTYTPAPGDAGRTVTITFTTNNPVGGECVPAVATYELEVSAVPPAPQPGTVTHPSCTTSTGSVVLGGLPSQGSWTIRRNPGNQTVNGSGTSATISGLQPGTYTFTVTQSGCSSVQSSEVRINERPFIPSAPDIGRITQTTCTSGTGSIELTGLPAQGQWTVIRNPGNNSLTGSGTSTTIQGLPAGTYTFTVTASTGCTSPPSDPANIRPQPVTPTPPVPGAITVPTCPNPTGRVVLSGLPPDGEWTVNSIPAGVSRSGRGTSTTVTGLLPGNYTFTVTSSAGCTSAASSGVVIPQVPNAPTVRITNPEPVCAPATIDLTAPAITAGSTPGLTYTYWRNPTTPVSNPQRVGNGIYFIRGTDANQCSDFQPVAAIVNVLTRAEAGPDQDLNYEFAASLDANDPQPGESGSWSVAAGSGIFEDQDSSVTNISRLSVGENLLVWTLTNGACPETSDTLVIRVKDLTIPSLITPNDDGRNDYFILEGIEIFTDNDLRIFDRRGVIVYKTSNYMNDWNGLDYNGKPLPPDTYFFVLTTGDGRSRSGYVVIRK